MILKGIIDTDHVNYKKLSMTIMFPYCNFKCDRECRLIVCQNNPLINEPDIIVDYDYIIRRYLDNPMSEAIVCQGLEPMDSFGDLIEFVRLFREKSDDDIVIYTGYYKEEIEDYINQLKQYKNIIVKFGRYIPGHQVHKDDILGVNLASDNQYAEKIS